MGFVAGLKAHDVSKNLRALVQKFSLPIAKGAFYNAYENQHEDMCLPDTRVELQRRIPAWAESLESECIFWLSGMAGTGKSTIARTMAKSFEDKGQLGASFFFKKANLTVRTPESSSRPLQSN